MLSTWLGFPAVEWALSACVGSLVVVALVVVRIFLGWAYVSDRLLSATYAYEVRLTDTRDIGTDLSKPRLASLACAITRPSLLPTFTLLSFSPIGDGLVRWPDVCQAAGGSDS